MLSVNSTLIATTELAAAETKKSVMYTIPEISWRLDWRTLRRCELPSSHIRRATMNQTNAIPANGITYRPTSRNRREDSLA